MRLGGILAVLPGRDASVAVSAMSPVQSVSHVLGPYPRCLSTPPCFLQVYETMRVVFCWFRKCGKQWC